VRLRRTDKTVGIVAPVAVKALETYLAFEHNAPRICMDISPLGYRTYLLNVKNLLAILPTLNRAFKGRYGSFR